MAAWSQRSRAFFMSLGVPLKSERSGFTLQDLLPELEEPQEFGQEFPHGSAPHPVGRNDQGDQGRRSAQPPR